MVMKAVILVLCSLPFLQAAPLNQTVMVGYYSESLCPDCLAFSTKHMNKAIEEDFSCKGCSQHRYYTTICSWDIHIGDIFVLNYVPWGNAKLVDGKFDCQHGEMECIVNTIDACLLKYYPDRDQFWPFIYCMDKEKGSQSPKVAEGCATENKMDWDKLNTCYMGNEGHQLELGYYNETASLQPPHKYTPWVTINGEHDAQAEGEGLIHQICKAYKGPSKPSKCTL